MENLGYKEGTAKAKPIGKRRGSRARGSVIENEALPLSITPRYKLLIYFFIAIHLKCA
jgi:hypothetical protein